MSAFDEIMAASYEQGEEDAIYVIAKYDSDVAKTKNIILQWCDLVLEHAEPQAVADGLRAVADELDEIFGDGS